MLFLIRLQNYCFSRIYANFAHLEFLDRFRAYCVFFARVCNLSSRQKERRRTQVSRLCRYASAPADPRFRVCAHPSKIKIALSAIKKKNKNSVFDHFTRKSAVWLYCEITFSFFFFFFIHAHIYVYIRVFCREKNKKNKKTPLYNIYVRYIYYIKALSLLCRR